MNLAEKIIVLVSIMAFVLSLIVFVYTLFTNENKTTEAYTKAKNELMDIYFK